MKRAVLALVLLVAPLLGGAAETTAPRRPPAFILPGLDGRQHELGEWSGKVVLLNFWASWCSPCQIEIRDLAVFQEQYGSRGLQVIGIGMDDETKLRNVQRTLGINYPVLFTGSPVHPVMLHFGNHDGVVPYTVVISRKGEMVYTHIGVITREIFEEQVIPQLK